MFVKYVFSKINYFIKLINIKSNKIHAMNIDAMNIEKTCIICLNKSNVNFINCEHNVCIGCQSKIKIYLSNYQVHCKCPNPTDLRPKRKRNRKRKRPIKRSVIVNKDTFDIKT